MRTFPFILSILAVLNTETAASLTPPLCGQQLANFAWCMEPVKKTRMTNYNAVKDGREIDQLNKRLQCFKNNSCNYPILIHAPLEIGMYCLKRQAFKLKGQIEQCVAGRLGDGYKMGDFELPMSPSNDDLPFDPFGEAWLAPDPRKAALALNPQPINLQQLVAALGNRPSPLTVDFDLLPGIAKAVFQFNVCPTRSNGSENVIECLKKMDPVADKAVYILNTQQSQRKFCQGRNDCYQRSLRPDCWRLFNHQRIHVCDCAKETLAKLNRSEVQNAMKSECSDGLDEGETKWEVIHPLFVRMFCSEPSRDACYPEEVNKPWIPLNRIWPERDPIPSLGTVRGIPLDGHLPIGKK